MSIGVALLKKAQEKGILLEEGPDGSNFTYRAFCVEVDAEFWGNNSAKLLASMTYARMMVLEHTGLSFEQNDEGAVTISFGKREIGTVETLDDLEEATTDALDDLSDEERAEALAEDEASEDEEERTGSVVPEKYKERYKEEGHPNNCGDWLAGILADLTTGKKGVDVEAVVELARLNDLDMGKVNLLATKSSNGWQGRLRMTVRNMLVKKIVANGELRIPAGTDGDAIKAPEAWVRANAPKTKEAGDKQAARKAASGA